jgi:hypothetical protein
VLFRSYYAQGFNQFGGNANALPTPTTYNIASHADFTALQALIRKTNHNTPIIVNIAQSFTTSSRITLGSVPAMITFEFLNSAILTYNGTGDNIFFSENSFVRINNCNIVGTGTNALRCARGGTIEVVGTCNISGSPTALYAYYNGQIVLSNTAGLTLTGNTNNYPASCIFTEEKVLRTKTDAERFLDVIFAKNPDDPTSKAWKEPAIPQIGDVVNGVLQHPDHSGGAGA